MPKILRVRAAQDEQEEHKVRQLAASRHGPADWIIHARMVVLSWDGEGVEAIAQELGCSAQTVRCRLHRFENEGIEGLGDRPRSGRPSRLTEAERSKLIALVRKAPPGRLERQADELVARDENGSAQWSLDALVQAANEAGIRVKRSQIRTILLREGVRWRHTHSWGTSTDPDFVPKGRRSSATTPSRPRGRRVFLTFQVLLDPVLPLARQKLTISTCFMAPRGGGINCELLCPLDPLSREMLPPVRRAQV
jgi:transposase